MATERILIDVDGVLADFTNPALQLLEKLTGEAPPADTTTEWDLLRNYPKEIQEAFWAGCTTEGWCYSLPIYPGAKEGIHKLQQHLDVYFVTSPMHGPHWAYERTKWLMHHFGVKSHNVVHTNAKYLCVGDYFVDDKDSHVEIWQRSHLGIAMLWDAPYNQSAAHPMRVKSWDDVLVEIGLSAGPGA